ncbi:fimbrial protein [Providencia rettgeri]
MKTITTLVFLLAMSVSFISSSVFSATGGTISFVGSLTDSTCNVKVNGSNDANATVNLPVINVSELGILGSTAGRVPFSLGLEDCAAGSKSSGVAKVSAFFEYGVSVDSNGLLNNIAGAMDKAGNVKLQLLDSKSSPISVGKMVDDKHYVTWGDPQSLSYSVEYYATGVATPGSVNSIVVYSLVYK